MAFQASLLSKACLPVAARIAVGRAQRVVVGPAFALRHRSSVAGLQQSSQQRLHRGAQQMRGRASLAVMAAAVADQATSFYDFKVKDIDGKDTNLSKYKGKVVLVINVASACGFTPQYKEMAELQSKYASKGFTILAFPCNQFGAQEPGTPQEIKKFAAKKGANFPIMEKVDVNGPSATPVYKFLKSKQGGLLFSDIKWNFTKMLVDKEGNVVKRYGSATTPMAIAEDIEKLL